jgi:hypothetical protein
MPEVFNVMAQGASLNMLRGGYALKGAAFAQVQPVMDRFRAKRGLQIESANAAKVKRIPCNGVLTLVGPVILLLKEFAMTQEADLFANIFDIVRGNDWTAVGNFHWKRTR